MIDALRSAGLFRAVSDGALVTLAAACHWREFHRGDFLYHAGDSASRIYVIASGRVAAKITSSQGTPLLFHVAEAGEIAGQVDALLGSRYSASAQALSRVRTLAAPSAAFVDLLRAEPAVLFQHAGDLSRIVTVLVESMTDLVFLDLEHRLARTLVNAAENGETFDLLLTQAELGAKLGVARQSVNAALARLSRRGLVAVRSGRLIRVVDRPGLTAFAQDGHR